MRIAALPAPAVLEDLFGAAARDLPRWLDHHGYDPLGLPPLRQAIAAWFDRRGLPTRPEQILVTNGAMHGLDLSIRAAIPRGRWALVEVPSYPVALDALRGAGARLAPVPVTGEGWDLDALRAVTRSHRPSFAYLMPDFHNPTGVLIDELARRRAMRLLRSAGTVVVIDETFVELNLDGIDMPAPTASYGDERTVTVGSLSKAVWGGLRIGWVRSDPAMIHRLVAARATSDMSGPLFEQIVATHVLEHFEEILVERRSVIRRRRDALADALRRSLPRWRFELPAGGMFLWAELPEPVSTSLAIAAGEQDLQITPGPRYAAAGVLERHLRLPFTLAPAQLERAVEILAGLIPGAVEDARPEDLAYVA
jgi:DNA-binding transcriptional MocR family regulator